MTARQLPPGFINQMKSYGNDTVVDSLLHALSQTAPSLAIRTNSIKGIGTAGGTPVAWLANGIYLDERPLFAADPAWHQGLYYVQDASSMAMTAIVEDLCAKYFNNEPVRYLDCCAAPGGKTIAAIEGLPAGSAVLANEYDRRRAAALAENTAKHGYPSIAISCADGASLGKLGPIFDIVAVDAPCSGEGMMRKEPEAVNQWSESLVKSCAATQRDIIAGVWQALRPGGILIYSTCTFNRLEDEENAEWIVNELGCESLSLVCADFDGVVPGFDTKLHCYRFMPGHVRGEGLFIAAFRKPEGDARAPKMKFKAPKADAAAAAFVKAHIKNAGDYSLLADGDLYSIVPSGEAPFFVYLAASLRLMRCGLPVCLAKGRDMVPAWELAFSTALDTDSFARLPLAYSAALSYLHGNSLTDLPDSLPKGFALATYKGLPLGFIKNIGRRANNLYPEALRLRINPAESPDTSFPLLNLPR